MKNNEIIHYATTIAIMAKTLGITQEGISEATGISQSQVSRVLSGSGKRQSKAFIEICNYVNSKKTGISPELVKQNDELINAIAQVWDGSARQAKALASVIQSLGAICSVSNQK